MNPRRVLAILNWHLKLNSYSLHTYQSNCSYVISKVGITIYLFTTAVYAGAMYIHYSKQEYFEQYMFLSKLFYNSIYRHLYIGCLGAVLIPLSFMGQWHFAQDMGRLVQNGLMTRPRQPLFDLIELFVYYKLYSNLIVFIGLSVYNIIMLDFEYFAWYKLMLFLGLFLPHYHIANIMNFFCANALLLRNMCLVINDEMQAVFFACERMNQEYPTADAHIPQRLQVVQDANVDYLGGANALSVISELWHQLAGRREQNLKPDFVPVLETIPSRQMLQQNLTESLNNFIIFQRMAKRLNGLLQKQLFVLSLHHLLVIFVAAHSFLKIKQEWKEFVPAADITSIRINFEFYLCLLINDFVCLFAVGSFYRSVVR